jgi:hypothetical protein
MYVLYNLDIQCDPDKQTRKTIIILLLFLGTNDKLVFEKPLSRKP